MWSEIFWTVVFYCSALLIPAVYLICTRFHGALVRRMLRGVGLQILWTVGWAVVGALLCLLHVPDMYMFPIWLIPINLGFIIYFSLVLVNNRGRSSQELAHQSAEPNGLPPVG